MIFQIILRFIFLVQLKQNAQHVENNLAKPLKVFVSFILLTAKRRSCCGFVLLARHIVALNFIMTSMCSESMFAPFRALISITSDQAVIDLVEGVSIYYYRSLKNDAFVRLPKKIKEHRSCTSQAD
jgi:hypothetical protein